MLALGGKLNHLGMEKASAKITACNGLRNRDNRFFEDLYFSLVKKYKSFLSDNSDILSKKTRWRVEKCIYMDNSKRDCSRLSNKTSFFLYLKAILLPDFSLLMNEKTT
jgi:hypothetical protein